MTTHKLNPESIQAYLTAIEAEYGITILGAWETGSRASGLSHTESDFDISFAFTQPRADLATKSFGTESIDADGTSISSEYIPSTRTDIPPEKIDFEGWSAAKFGELASNSDPSILRAINSPITYRPNYAFDGLREYLNEHFNILSAHSSLISQAKGNYYNYIKSGDEPTIKRNYIIFRSIFAAEYIAETGEYPQIKHFGMADAAKQLPTDWDFKQIQSWKQARRAGDGDEEIGNPLQETFENAFETDLNPQEHLRDDHEFTDEEAENDPGYQHKDIPLSEFPSDGYTCHPPHCNGNPQQIHIDFYIQKAIKNYA